MRFYHWLLIVLMWVVLYVILIDASATLQLMGVFLAWCLTMIGLALTDWSDGSE